MCKIGFDIVAIKSYIIDELKNNKEFLFNELDLQMFVARALDKKFPRRKYTIHLEYHLPQEWNKTFCDNYTTIWGTEKPYFDIVIEQKFPNNFIVIELKYKLKKIEIQSDSSSYRRFGEQKPKDTDVQLVTDQSASNEGRYDFWKDVKRLEVLNNSFSKVVGGIAILVTNDDNYLTTNENCKYTKFGLTEEKTGFLFWAHDASARTAKPTCCKLNTSCGESDNCAVCGEKLKDKKNGTNINDFERPNFSLKRKYIGEWFNGRDKEKGGFLNEGLKQRYYCYSVLVSNNDK